MADTDERPELDTFFQIIGAFRAAIVGRYARELNASHGVPFNDAERIARDICDDIVFRLFAAIDGVSGPDDLPALDLVVLDDGESLNASPLHELYHERFGP